MHGREANAAAIRRDDEEHGTPSEARHMHDLNTLVKHDYRADTCLAHSLLGLKSYGAAQCLLAGT